MKWTVFMKVERLISVIVEAETEAQAKAKAMSWDIIGDEREDHTSSLEVTRAIANS